MKKVLFLVVAALIVTFAGISSALAQEAAPEKPKAAAMKSETLSGTLQMVVVEKKLVVVAAANGIPYNFKVTSATKIRVGGNKAKLADLAGSTGKTVSVKFLSEKRAGNLVQSIEVQ
jgi:maltose-binding protein MalE